METYSLLRQFADSWMLLGLVLFFLGVIVWVFRPSRRAIHDDAAMMIFRNERAPARTPGPEADPATTSEARK
jgi:cytochrome c oxidase cbb3-type subunit 4